VHELPALLIRRAQPADAHALTRIAHAAKRHWGYPETLIELWTADLTVSGDFVDAHPVHCAVRGSDVLGFYALSGADEVFELEHLWVDPAHMGAGLGTLLFEHAIATVRSLGGSLLRIESDPNAEGFYRRMGAHRIGEVAARPPGRVLPLLVFDLGAPDGQASA
jgi:GNAT superfamily N-acetyltransferase